MKKNNYCPTLCFALALLLYLTSCMGQPTKEKFLLLIGEIENYQKLEIELKSTGIRYKTTIQDGRFEFKIPAEDQPSIYQLSFEESDVPVFLIPNEPLHVSFDVREIGKTLEYKGKTKRESEYFFKISQVNDYDTMNDRLASGDYSSFIKSHEEYYSKKEEELDLLRQTDVPLYRDFFALAKRNIEYKSAEEKLYFGMNPANAGVNSIQLLSTYYSFLEHLKYNQVELIQLPNFKSFLNAFVAYKTSNKFNSTINEKFKIIDQEFTENKIKALAYYQQLYFEINYMGKIGIEKELLFFHDFNTNPVYREDLIKIENDWEILAKGNQAPDIQAFDAKGKKVLLSDFKGKVVYIDLWATWCAPCVAEIPYLNEIKKKYKNNSRLEIIGISLDDKPKAWKSFLEKKGMEGTQLWVENSFNSQLSKDYLVKGIPRFILIDAKGKIISANAPLPSEKEKLIAMIDELIIP